MQGGMPSATAGSEAALRPPGDGDLPRDTGAERDPNLRGTAGLASTVTLSPLILRITVSRVKSAFSQVLLPSLTRTKVSKRKSQRAAAIAPPVLLLLYGNLSHTERPREEGSSGDASNRR